MHGTVLCVYFVTKDIALTCTVTMDGQDSSTKQSGVNHREKWDAIDVEHKALQALHKTYAKKVQDVKNLQASLKKGITSLRKNINNELNDLESDESAGVVIENVDEFRNSTKEKLESCGEIDDVLPHENGLYLLVVLGSVNVSLLSKSDKFKYKENYENFKYYVTMISLWISSALFILPPFRVLDAVYEFLLLWYYCTLTVREHILVVNGSRIKGWWISHHFISLISSGVILIWPDGRTYQAFRGQFLSFAMFISIVQIAQYYYQSGMLYRLRSLGERRNMDITVEGFQHWMWKGLSFLLPFLGVGYVWELYNAYTLYLLAYNPECTEWQVPFLSALFFVIAFGNITTMFHVIRAKLQREGWIHTPSILLKKYDFPQTGTLFSRVETTIAPDDKVQKQDLLKSHME